MAIQGPIRYGANGGVTFQIKNADSLFRDGAKFCTPAIDCKSGYALGVKAEFFRDYLRFYLFVAKGRRDDALRWPFDLPVTLFVQSAAANGGAAAVHRARVEPVPTEVAFLKPLEGRRRNPCFRAQHLAVSKLELSRLLYDGRGEADGANDLLVILETEPPPPPTTPTTATATAEAAAAAEAAEAEAAAAAAAAAAAVAAAADERAAKEKKARDDELYALAAAEQRRRQLWAKEAFDERRRKQALAFWHLQQQRSAGPAVGPPPPPSSSQYCQRCTRRDASPFHGADVECDCGGHCKKQRGV